LYLLGLVYINFPKNIVSRKRVVYSNESGHTIVNLIANSFDKRLDSTDFRRFTLSNDTVKYIESVIHDSTIPLELFLNARSNAKVIVDGIL